VRVVVTGATGGAGRAVCARLGERGDHVIAVGTDAARLAEVDADERLLADLTAPDAVRTLAEEVRRVDAVLHLVGGWRPGNTPEADAWLRPRLVDALANVIAAFEPLLAASEGRLAIVSTTAVTPDAEPTSSYTRARPTPRSSWRSWATASGARAARRPCSSSVRSARRAPLRPSSPSASPPGCTRTRRP